jgi:BNR repeat-like domain
MKTKQMLSVGALLLSCVVGARGQFYDRPVVTDPSDQAQMSIAVDPINSNVLFAGWINGTMLVEHPGFSFSTDGGVSWTALRTLAPQGADPSVGFGRNEKAYFCIHNTDDGRIYVFRTSDLGQTWFDTTASIESGDKSSIAIDNSQGPHSGRVYVAWKSNRDVLFSYSTDQGVTFQTPEILHQESEMSPQTGVKYQCPVPVVGPDGTVYVVYMDYSTYQGAQYAILIRKSTDGGTSFEAPNTIALSDFYSTYYSVGKYFIYDFPSVAVDPVTGKIYVAFQFPDPSYSNLPIEIRFKWSSDMGNTWSDGIDMGLDYSSWSFHPSISVDPTGKFSMSFLSTPNPDDPHAFVNAYLIESYDNGLTFSDYARISRDNSDAGVGGLFTEYESIVSSVGKMFPIWTDTRSGTNEDPYVALLIGPPTSSNAWATGYGSALRSVYTSTDQRWNVIFASSGSVYHTYSTNDGQSWSGYDRISGAALTVGASSNPCLVKTANGNLHALWGNGADYSGMYYNRRVAGTWQATPFTVMQGTALTPSFRVGSNNLAQITWVTTSIALQSSLLTNYLKYGSFDVTAGNPTVGGISTITSSTATIRSPSIALDQNNKPHVAWQSAGDIYYSNKAGSSWTSPLLVSDHSKPAASPTVVAIGTTVYLAWQASNAGNNEIYYRSRLSNGIWSAITNLSNDAGSSIEPFIDADILNGEPCIIWSDNTGGSFDIRYRLPVSGVSGSLKSTGPPSHFPTFAMRTANGAERILAFWTDGSTSPFILEHDWQNVMPLLDRQTEGTSSEADVEVATPSPTQYCLRGAFPNPFNPSTRIDYQLPSDGMVTAVIYDILGRPVAELVNRWQTAGSHSTRWNGSNVSSGLYICRLTVSSGTGRTLFSDNARLMLIK